MIFDMKPDFDSEERLRFIATNFRYDLELIFSQETANPGSQPYPPSSGHSAVVALLFQALYGGDIFSTMVGGQGHWYNLVRLPGEDWATVDLTGDKFGLPPIQIEVRKHLYPEHRQVYADQINLETRKRFLLLKERFDGIIDVPVTETKYHRIVRPVYSKFWRAIHNLIAHPMLAIYRPWGQKLHDWTAEKMYTPIEGRTPINTDSD